MDLATRPNYLNIPSLKEDEKAEKKGATDEERFLFSMSKSRGWGIFKEFVEGVKEELDLATTEAINKGASLEEIGQNTIVINLTKGMIDRMINKVEDAREICESAE